jgi:hypothetical protein
LDGSGTLSFAAGSLNIVDALSSDLVLKLTGTFTKNAVAFTAASEMVSADDANGLGFTVSKVAKSDSVDNFIVATVDFAGLDFGKTSANIAKAIQQHSQHPLIRMAQPYRLAQRFCLA